MRNFLLKARVKLIHNRDRKSDTSEVIIKGSIHKLEELIAQKCMVPPTEKILIQHSAIMKYICE